MILVDTSVWVARLREQNTAATAKLGSAAVREQLLIGDLILLEILQGARDDIHAARLERNMRRFPVVSLLDDALAIQGARNYRRLRSLGITVRKTADNIIGTFCIERGCALLHDDRDFVPMERHLGLRTV